MLRMKAALVGTIGVSLLLASCSAMGQVPDPVMAAQAPIPGSGHNYIGLATETVNPADGSLTFDLPLPLPPGRGISLPFSIHYDSGLMYYLSPYNDLTSTFPSLNWVPTPQSSGPFAVPFLSFQAAVKGAPQYIATGQGQTSTYEQCNWTTGFVFRGLDGVQYPMGQIGATWSDEASAPGDTPDPNCPYSPPAGGTFHGILVTPGTQDPNQNYGQPSMVLTDASGTTYSFPAVPIGQISSFVPFTEPELLFPQTITDRNGNQMTLSTLGNQNFAYVDALGRTVVSWNTSGSGTTIAVSGFGDVSMSFTTSTGSLTLPGTITDTGHTNQACVKNTTQPYATTYTQQSVITLPNGDTYTLSFDQSFGQINKIQFPGKGYVRYVWGLNSGSSSGNASYTFTNDNVVYNESCSYQFDTPAITDRYVSFDGSNEVLHQHFSYSTSPSTGSWTTKTTTVTTTDTVTGQASITNYTYGPILADAYNTSSWLSAAAPVETQIQYENGSGTVLETVNKTWADVRHVIGEQTILYNPQGGNPQGSAKQYCYDANEQLVAVYEYGFQSENPKTGDPYCYTSAFSLGGGRQGDPGLANSQIGPLKRYTITALHDFAGASPSTHITNEPDSVTVYDGSGNQVKQTSYVYDGSAIAGSAVTTSTGLVSPPGERGNATSITQWSNAGSSSTTTYTYYETGQLASKTDPCGNTACSDISGSSYKTSYSYTDNPSGGNQPGNSNAYLTAVTDPLGHMRSFSYNYPSGKLTTSTDSNGETTTYHYNTQGSQCNTADGLDRLTEIDYPDGGVTSYCYNDSVPSVTTNQLLSGSTWKTSVSTMDGLGHVTKTQLQVGGGAADYTATSYDGLGQVYQMWNPSHCDPTTQSSCSGESTWGVTTYGYDALGRKSSQANSDGTSSESWSYNANLVTFQDENNNQWQQTTDGLGRLVTVLEPNGASAAPSMETDYMYDLNDNLTRVDQWGGAQGSTGEIARTFTYDSLSRLLCASNPESATNPQTLATVACPSQASSTYTAGTLGYSYDANGNVNTREDARGVITTYGYDALNRVLSKSYNDSGATPAVSFAYDSGVLGITSGNYVGRLAQVTTLSGSSVLYNYSTLGYDAVGRPLGYVECPGASNCMSGAATVLGANYQYDLAGDPTQVTSQGTIASNGTTVGGMNQRNYSYDAAGQLNTVTADARLVGAQDAGSNTLFNTPTYNAGGQLTAAGLALNSSTQQSMIGVTRSYDNRLRPVSESDSGQVGTPGTAASVTVNVNGAEQSVGGSGAASPATGTISLSYMAPQVMRPAIKPTPLYVGSSITLPSGYRASFVAPSNSAVGVANAIAAVLNAASSPVTAVVASGGTASSASLTLTTKTSGAEQNGAIQLTLVSQVTASPASMSGGGGATYDTGTVTATIGSTNFTVSYGQASTPATVASALASAISAGQAGWVASANSGSLTVTASTPGTADNGVTVTFYSSSSEPSLFSSPSFSGASGTLSGGTAGALSPGTIYSYSIPAPGASLGYDGAGNVHSFTDLVNGQWTAIGYDTLNRLSTATVAGTPSTTLSWGYDAFGNRGAQGPNGGAVNYAPGINRISGYGYDFSGNVLNDGVNQYVYDGEGRLCTVYNTAMASYMGYAYDGLGHRVAKGTPASSLSCDNNLTVTSMFIMGQNGEQLDALSATGAVYSNVFAGGQLLATYQFPSSSWNYALNDWLGTKRFVADANGEKVETCTSLPFGDELGCTGTDDPSRQHFTGKERDAESGNDYFIARYYGSSMGRFMSPDSGADSELGVPVPFADLENPQSLNLYSYVTNNPLRFTDPDGQAHWGDCNDGSGDQCLFGDTLGERSWQNGRNVYWNGSAWDSHPPMDDGRVNDLSGGQLLMAAPIGKLLGSLVGSAMGKVGEALSAALGKAGESAAAGGAKTLLSNGSKAAAKDIVDGLSDGAQKASAKRAVAAATRSESVSISQGADGTLTISRTRPGIDGSQTFTKTIDSAGNSSTVQTAHDAAGNLVHYDPKN